MLEKLAAVDGVTGATEHVPDVVGVVVATVAVAVDPVAVDRVVDAIGAVAQVRTSLADHFSTSVF